MGKNKRLRQQIEQMMLQQFRQLNQPDPELQRLMGFNQSVLDWYSNPTNTVKDIYKHPTIGAKLPVYQLAKTNRDAGRIGRGVAGLGEKYSGMYAKDLALEDDFRRNETAAGILEGTLADEQDKATANLLNLKQMDIGRRTGANSMIQYLHGVVNQRAQQNGWSAMLRGMVPGLARAGIGALL